MARESKKRETGLHIRTLSVAVAACFAASPTWSLPTGATVSSGTATFDQVGQVLNITNSNKAILNWPKFGIPAGETVNFIQGSASSWVMNRVLAGGGLSAIYGTLSSNGKVFLINPAGILIGPGGQIDTAAFIASTLAVRDSDFLAGKLTFSGGGGSVTNQGTITTPTGGSVYLIGANVSNEGIINTPKGEVILAAGQTVNLVDTATPGVKVEIVGAAGNTTNLGTIAAEAGRIGMAGVIVRNSGTLNASSAVEEGGKVFLRASQDTYVDGNGRIVATGTKGGQVEVTGDRVAVMDNAQIDVSGASGGGTVLVGGDYQGSNADVQNAQITYFGSNASISADATGNGDGGKVIVWADDTTRAFGAISARGGANGGDGGLVETSGHRFLDVAGARINTSAPNGKTGTWLLDPTDITITNTPPTSGGTLTAGYFTAAAGSATVYAGDINSNLLGTAVTIQSNSGYGGGGNITVTGAHIYGPSSLSLLAYGGAGATGNLSVSNSLISTNGLTLVAGWYGGSILDPSTTGTTATLTVTDSGLYSTAGMTLRAAGNMNLNGGTKGTWIQSAGAMDVRARNITLLGGNTVGLNPLNSTYGSGVMVLSFGPQTITATDNIKLQAGSANNSLAYGDGIYGGSVGFRSLGDQTITATKLEILAGATGHDNMAGVEAYGSQIINLGSTGKPGQLILKGGGTANSSTYYGGYGGGVGGSFNNLVEVRQNSTVGTQLINLHGGSAALVSITGGAGTGYGGWSDMNCPDCAGLSSTNRAEIVAEGGTQTIDFVYGGTLTIQGGSGGGDNWAGIHAGWGGNATQVVYSSNGDTYLPAITLTGGSGGRVSAYGYDNMGNAAEIGSGSDMGWTSSTVVKGSTIVIDGGGDATTVAGGAGIGSGGGGAGGYVGVWARDSLTLIGGKSNVPSTEPLPGVTTAAWIGVEDGGTVVIRAGNGGISLQGGSGTEGGAFIGSPEGGLTPVSIDIQTYGGVTLTANASPVAIGNFTTDTTYGGANLTIRAGGKITATASPTAGVFIGSKVDNSSGAQSNINLFADGNVTLTGSNANYGGVFVGVETPTWPGSTSSVDIVAGYGSWNYTGGNVNLNAYTRVQGGPSGNVWIEAARGSTALTGNIAQAYGSEIIGGGVRIMADSNVALNGAVIAQGYGSNRDLVVAAGMNHLGYYSAPFYYTAQANAYGGSITFGANSILDAWNGKVIAQAGRGGMTGAGGNITQLAGGSIYGDDGVNLIAGGDATINGLVRAYDGSIVIAAGVSGGLYGSAGPYGFSTNPDGGSVTLGAGSVVNAYYGVSIIAERGYSTNAGGNITQAYGGEIVAGWDGGEGNVWISGGGNVTLRGSVEAWSYWSNSNYGNVIVKAGYSDTSGQPNGYGGSIELGGGSRIMAGYDVALSAERGTNTGFAGAGGGITQAYGGQIVAGYDGGDGNVLIVAGGNAILNGSVQAEGSGPYGNIDIRSGFSDYYNGPNGFGGSITFGGSSEILADNRIWATAYGGSLNPGNITQLSDGGFISGKYGSTSYGSALIGKYGVNLHAAGSVTINGAVIGGPGSGDGSIVITAGMDPAMGFAATGYGGDISFGPNSFLVSGNQVVAVAYGGSLLGGNITQLSNGGKYGATPPSMIMGKYGVNLHAGGNATVNGLVGTSDGSVVITAGWNIGGDISGGSNTFNPDFWTANATGGNVSLGATSLIAGYTGVGIYAYGGSVNPGDITQAYGGEIIAESNGIYVTGWGNVHLRGSTIANNGGNVYIEGGYMDGATSAATAHSVGIGYVYGGNVSVYGSGAILDENGGGVTNIAATSIYLSSVYGGSAGLAISTDTETTGTIFGTVSPFATNGGIRVTNDGDMPSSVTLIDSAMSGAGTGVVTFSNTEDIASLNGIWLAAGSGGVARVGSYGDMVVDDGGSFSGGSIVFAAGKTLSVEYDHGNSSTNIGLQGGIVDINSNVTGKNVAIGGGTVNVNSGYTVTADNGAYGGTIGIVAHTANLEGTLDARHAIGLYTVNLNVYGGQVLAGNAIEFTAHNAMLDDGALMKTTTGNIIGDVMFDLRMNNASKIWAGNDTTINMLSGTSVIFMDGASQIIADPTTVHINFFNRPGGGIVIDGMPTLTTLDGGSGFFNSSDGSTFSPAVLGSGVIVTYSLDQCTLFPSLCASAPEAPNDAEYCAENPTDPVCTVKKKADEEKQAKQCRS